MAEDKDAAVKAEKLVKAVVAPRRSVVVVDKLHPRGRSVGPGTMVDLPAAEVARLRALGFLVDPKAPEIEVQDGSQVVHEIG